MSDQISDIVIPILRGLQSDVASLKSDVATLKADMGVMKESVRRIDARFGSVDTLVAGIYNTSRWQSAELDDHRLRLDSLEDKNNLPPTTGK